MPSRVHQILLVVLIFIGISFRFVGQDWNEGANLHPDEYGLTNTITQLRLPDNLADYFNTRLSPISPYQKLDENGVITADGPDNRMRWGQWPIILIRAAAEWTDNTGYDELRLLGRKLSAGADLLTLLLILAIGWRLYGRTEGLLAAALYSLAVLPIQQSHFMTVDSFASVFSTLAMYAAVRMGQSLLARRDAVGFYRVNRAVLGWSLLFGTTLGMALASKINLAPLAGLALVAVALAAADLPLRRRADLRGILLAGAWALVVVGLAALVTFRLTQPMSFRAPTGDTTLFTFHPNPDWVESMRVASNESSGMGGGPPSEQWSRRPLLVFPLVNMLLWGMGLPLGMAAWAGLIAAVWQSFRPSRSSETSMVYTGWRPHLLPLVWTLGYFAFMATRWVSSIRYFLPIYPFFCLMAAWGLLAWLRRARPRLRWLPALALAVTLAGTLTWAAAFTRTVYGETHTRLRASRWIIQSVPGPVQLIITGEDGRPITQSIAAPNALRIGADSPYFQAFTAAASGQLSQIVFAHVSSVEGESTLYATVSSDPQGRQALAQADVDVLAGAFGSATVSVSAEFLPVQLVAGQTYYLTVVAAEGQPVDLFQTVIAVEDWDEGLPARIDGWDPFSQLYRGVDMPVRWADDEAKREGFLRVLEQADWIVLSSQRGLWSTCRIPRMYPMTMAYYQALFDGSLGFSQEAHFSAPIQVGPLYISDVAGVVGWGQAPELPVFNNNLLAAEEAFSVYDHPPVWIFKKDEDFSLEKAAELLGSVDLSLVVNQSPKEATGPICQ